MQFSIAIRSVVVRDFPQDVLQCLVPEFGQAVGLRIVWRILFVNNRVIVREAVDYFIEEIASLVTYWLD